MAFHSTFASPDPDDAGADPAQSMREMLGPGRVDDQIRAAISACWMMLPQERRNADAVAFEIRKIVDRALANLKEDAVTFGVNPKP